jgi:carboxyl-terminal processing protease
MIFSRVFLVAALLSLPAFAGTTAVVPSAGPAPGRTQERYEDIELFTRALHQIEANYVDESKVQHKQLIYGAIRGMMETLDPHSNFLSEEIFKDMKNETSGRFGGLGIEIGMKDNVLTVMTPIEDTPAWKAGIKANDRIVKINGESTKGLTLAEAVAKMRGKKGTEVRMGIFREGFEKVREFTVMREDIKIQAVKSEELEPAYGYVKLSTFNENAAHDIRKALDKLEGKRKLRGLVFDLRGNPGGLLDQAVEVTSLFIDEGVVVSTIPRNKEQKEVKYARKGLARKDLPVAILVNSMTASAAEIVSGALQDSHRAVIMGQTTFGKGSVQSVMDLNPEVGMKLTIARYYTPSGRSIQEKGVQPDIFLDDYDPKLLSEARKRGESFRERDLRGHMVNTDPLENGDSGAKEFLKEDLDAMILKDAAPSTKGDKRKALADEEPVRMNPREDYQVREALNTLKSYEILARLRSGEPKVEQKSADNR